MSEISYSYLYSYLFSLTFYKSAVDQMIEKIILQHLNRELSNNLKFFVVINNNFQKSFLACGYVMQDTKILIC